MNTHSKWLLQSALYSLLLHPCVMNAAEDLSDDEASYAQETRRGLTKHFTNVNVQDTLTTNALQVTNGANITGGLKVLGSLVSNGSPVAVVPQYAFVGDLAQGGGQVVADNAAVTFTYTTQAVSSTGITVPASGNSTFTVNQAGTYLIQYSIIARNVGANNSIIALKSGGVTISNSITGSPDTNGTSQMIATFITNFTAGQTFQLVNITGANLSFANDVNFVASNGLAAYLVALQIA